MKRIALSLFLVLTFGVSGCWVPFRRHKPKTVPPPPIVAPQPTAETKPEIKPEIKPATPPETKPETKLEAEPVEAPPEPPEQNPEVKPAPKKTPHKPVQPVVATPPAAPPASPPAPAPAATAPVPQSVPQLGVLLTPEQRNQYEADYASSLQSAQEGLVRTAGFSLSAAQKESVSRIRSFMHQAEDLHGRDLATAAQLARRAAVLSQDLAQSMR